MVFVYSFLNLYEASMESDNDPKKTTNITNFGVLKLSRFIKAFSIAFYNFVRAFSFR